MKPASAPAAGGGGGTIPRVATAQPAQPAQPAPPAQAAQPAQPRAGQGRLVSPLRRRARWLYPSIWLLFLVPAGEAAAGSVATDGRRVVGVVAVLALVGFAALYVLLWQRWQDGDARTGLVGVPHRHAVGGLLALVALGALALPGAGPWGVNTFVFVCTWAVFALPGRQAAGVVGTVLVGMLVVDLAVAEWDLLGAALGVVLASIAVYGISRMVRMNRRLALAQQDLARLAVAEERGRVARDLHDLLGHSLTVVTLKAQLAGRLLEADPQRAAAEVADVERLAREALADVRAALSGYREVSLETELAGALEALAAAGIEAQVQGTVEDVPEARRELFAWAVREGVTNVVRHSGARRCWVELSAEEVVVGDDGSGPRSGDGTGSGLAGLADRARQGGGTLLVGRSAAGGFRLAVRVPTLPLPARVAP